jgi:hypothetical protein
MPLFDLIDPAYRLLDPALARLGDPSCCGRVKSGASCSPSGLLLDGVELGLCGQVGVAGEGVDGLKRSVEGFA